MMMMMMMMMLVLVVVVVVMVVAMVVMVVCMCMGMCLCLPLSLSLSLSIAKAGGEQVAFPCSRSGLFECMGSSSEYPFHSPIHIHHAVPCSCTKTILISQRP